jgi:hypothetical protein
VRSLVTLGLIAVLHLGSGCYIQTGLMTGFIDNDATDWVQEVSDEDITQPAAVVGIPIYPLVLDKEGGTFTLLGGDVSMTRWSARANMLNVALGAHWFRSLSGKASDPVLLHLGVMPSYHRLTADDFNAKETVGLHGVIGLDYKPGKLEDGAAVFGEVRLHYLGFGSVNGDQLHNAGGSLVVGLRWHMWAWFQKDRY